METAIPMLLRETMSDFGMKAVDGWWSELDEQARGEVIALWQDAGGKSGCTVRVEGRIAEEDTSAADTGDDEALWHNDFYEYLVNHELSFAEPRVFHICTQLAEARASAKAGFIPGNFRCPEANHDCPMREILEFTRGKAVRLRIAFTPAAGKPGNGL